MKKIYIIGISRWKKSKIKPFFPYKQIEFIPQWNNNIDDAKMIIIWGNKNSKELKKYAQENSIPIYGVEDGFIRSISLGLSFSQPYSLIIDSRGIYFDTTQESDLEYILNSYSFTKELLKRTKNIQDYIVNNRLSKYNIYDDRDIKIDKQDNQKVILVVGQVEGDASLIYGADNMKNIELLQSVSRDNQDAYIIYKPHPDVLSGKRDGDIEDSMALKYCNRIEKEVSIDTLLSLVDEVHTMTSLVGFEALLRDKRVVCYGIPFYAGWGLTIDKREVARRKRKLTLLELLAGAYILYPKYIDPISLKPCEIERVLEVLTKEKKLYHNSLFYRTKIKVKNFLTIKYYALLRRLLRD